MKTQLIAIMADIGISVEDLAARARVSTKTISQIRMGRPVSTASIECVAWALGLCAQDLLCPWPEDGFPPADQSAADHK